MAHNNYSVTSSAITANVGDQVNLTTPSVILTITAVKGYTVTHTDFSIGDALPSEVTSAVFSQNGLVVECLVTFDNSFIMPAAEVNLPIDIDGAAVLNVYTLAGTYSTLVTNTTGSNETDIPYSANGDFGEQVTVFTKIFTADANHAFLVDPTVIVVDGVDADYQISRDDAFTDDELTQVTYTIKYTFGNSSVANDFIGFTAYAEPLLIIPPGTEEYHSYVFDNFDIIDSDGDFYTDYTAQTHLLGIFGDIGARITIDIDDGGGPVNIVTLQEITFGGGYAKIPILFPTVSSDTTYSIALSGDISAGFIQPNPIIVHQQAGVTITFANDALSGYTIVRSGNYSVTGLTGFVEASERLTTQLNTIFTITKDDGSNIKLLRNSTWSDVSNTSFGTNGGTRILFVTAMPITGDGTDTIVLEMNGTVTIFGDSNVTLSLSLDNLFNLNPIAVDDAANVEKGSSVLIDVLANDSDADGHTLRPVIITEPAFGTAIIEGTKIRYTHDNSTNYVDLFTYAANDGYINSNSATVSIGIGIAAGDSLEVSETDGIFYIPVVVGDPGGTFTVHFDGGATPDRIELLYEGDIVADSLFIGDDLTDGGRAAAITLIEGTIALDSFDYVGSNGNGTSHGKTAAWNLDVLDNVVSYSDPTDIAPTGNTRTNPNSNFGGQFGVGNLVYTSVEDVTGVTGLDSADGNASISYNKASGGSSIIIVKITGIAGTGWSIYQTSMV